MPRNGSGVYSLPPGLPVNGETSNATDDVRTPFSDLEADMNTARPIVAGGTGASTAADARTNLGVTLPNLGVTIPASVINQGPDEGNRIINGAFDFWQRGTSATVGGYLADRWSADIAGGTVTTSRQSFTLGDTLGSNSPTFFLRQTVSGQTLASHYAKHDHKIEGVRSYAGQTITVLGWARRSSGSGNMAIDAFQNFGTGGSPSSLVFIAPQSVTLTGSWAPFAVTFAVPSVLGKTLGSNNNDCLTLGFWTSAGSDNSSRTNSLGLQTIGVDLWGIHIKLGTHTTAAVDLYKAPEPGPEFSRCQRYYEIGATQFGSAAVDASGVIYSRVNFMVPKRGTYSISRIDTILTNALATVTTVDSVFGFDIQSGAISTGTLIRVRTIWQVDAEL